MFNPLMLLSLKQEIEKFRNNEESKLKIYKIQKYPGFVSFELSLDDKFFKDLGIAQYLPKDLPQLEGGQDGQK